MPLRFPFLAKASALSTKKGQMGWSRLPMARESTAMGIARAMAASVPSPSEMANAQASTPPMVSLGGT